jgi:hypothetical protein
MNVFGDMAVINYHHNRNMKAKFDDGGVTVVYLGRAQDYSKDTHRFFNLKTKKVILSCDARWLDKSYHDYFKPQQQLLSFSSKNPFSIFEDDDDDEEEAILSLPDGDTNDDLGEFLDNTDNNVDMVDQGRVPPPTRAHGGVQVNRAKYSKEQRA